MWGFSSSRSLAIDLGNRAYDMLEKTHNNLKAVKPMRGGVISDSDSASKILKELVKKVEKQSAFSRGYNYLISGVPYDTTAVEKRALRNTLDQFSARKTFLVLEPISAALGMGLNIQEPNGKLVADIGGGIAEVVIISLSGIAAFQSIRIAGDTIDEEIQDYFRREHNMSIGLKTAEMLKKQIGCVYAPVATTEKVLVKGKDLMEGIPVSQQISQQELTEVIVKPFQQIEECIQHSLEMCPPELSSDIYQSGMYVTGGNAQLKGIQERFSKLFKLKVNIDTQPLLSVSKGISKILSTPENYRSVLI